MRNKISTLILVIFILLTLQVKGFCMNPYAQIATNLKQKGYRQDLVPGDMVYSPNGDQYVKFVGNVSILPPNWVKVPQTVEIMNELIDCQYILTHSSTTDGIGGFKESWSLTAGGQIFVADNIWVVMSNYWISKKGK